MALSKRQLLLPGDRDSANNRREGETYLSLMLIAPFVHPVFCLVLDYRETLGLRPAVGGWLPAGDLCGLWLGLVTESASSSHFPGRWLCNYDTPIRVWLQLPGSRCADHLGQTSVLGGLPGMTGPPGG